MVLRVRLQERDGIIPNLLLQHQVELKPFLVVIETVPNIIRHK